MQVRRPAQPRLEVPQFRRQSFLFLDLLVQCLDALARDPRLGKLGAERLQAALLQADLGLDGVTSGASSSAPTHSHQVKPSQPKLRSR